MQLRQYQKAIVDSVNKHGNTLIVLPTGLGKTIIAFHLIKQVCERGGRALFLAPTKPLVKQHLNNFKTLYPNISACEISGDVNAQKRVQLYKETQVFFATPQTVEKDIEKGVITPDFFQFIVFDEAHRGVGKYAYTTISNYFTTAKRIGLTASPGGDRERIEEVMENLKLQHVEIRTHQSPDVKPYVKPIEIRWVFVQLPPTLKKCKAWLEKMSERFVKGLAEYGIRVNVKRKGELMEKRKDILNINHKIKYILLKYYFTLVLAQHALELLETQGVKALKTFLQELKHRDTKSAQMFLKQAEVKELERLLASTDVEHPKLEKLVELLKRLKDKKVIVFSQYRHQVEVIVEKLRAEGIDARVFMGKRHGFTAKKQNQVIEQFRNDVFKVLVSTSIGEEGLDIPGVDVVVFYEPVPNEIRAIQRRGRAGRFDKGEVYIMITKGTRDEAFFWVAMRKEKRMVHTVSKMQNSERPQQKKPQSSITDFL